MSDIALYSSGNLDWSGHRLNLVTGEAAIEQQIRIRLRTFLGEWFLDERVGIPYFRDILIKAPDTLLIESIYRQAIVTTPGISGVDSITAEVDTATRKLSLEFTATMDTGAALTFSPFVLEL